MARAKKVKKQDHEKLDNATIARVIELLEAEKPITKKAACEILRITYNTSRLGRIIEEYKNRIAYEKTRRSKNRGKPIDRSELVYMVTEYLRGEPISTIADSLYRNSGLVKATLIANQVPIRETGITYQNPALIPDENLKEEYEAGELVWSARYNCMAEVVKEVSDTLQYGRVYKVWIFGKHNEFGHQPWYEMGSLPILETLNITKKDITISEKLNLNYG